jgi:hypothetical protein
MLSNEISNEIQHIDQEIINNNLLPDISLNILNTLKKKIISIYIKYIKNISNKFLTINLHITIMIIFELYFYFSIVILIEREKFLKKINTIFETTNPLQLNYIQEKLVSQIIIENNAVSDKLYQQYIYSNEVQKQLLEHLLYKSIGMSIMSSIPTFIFTLNAIYHRKIIEWYWIIIENLLMFFLLGIFEYLFFINIVLKYDPITNDEVKYLLNIQFIRYLNETLNI